MTKKNENNFVGGTMAGIPIPVEDKGKIQPPTPIHTGRKTTFTAGIADATGRQAKVLLTDDSELVVRFDQLRVGAFYMNQYKPNHYICYTKMSESDIPGETQVLIFKRQEATALKAVSAP